MCDIRDKIINYSHVLIRKHKISLVDPYEGNNWELNWKSLSKQIGCDYGLILTQRSAITVLQMVYVSLIFAQYIVGNFPA